MTGGFSGQHPRRGCGHLPARRSGAGERRFAFAQDESGDARFLGSQHQLAAGRQIKRPGRAERFDDRRRQPDAADNIRPCTQRGEGVGRLDEDDILRIRAKLSHARAVKRSGHSFGFVLAHPEDRPTLRPRAQSEHQREGAGGRVILGLCTQFVNRPSCQPATETGIDGIATEREHPRPLLGEGRTLDAFKALPEARELCLRIGHS